VADAEGIDCSDEELDDELEAVATRVGQSAEEVRARFERVGQISAIRSDIRKRKALEWLLERVEVVDPDGNAIDRSELELPADDEDDDPDGHEPDGETATDEAAEGTDEN
jgi:trigger factor